MFGLSKKAPLLTARLSGAFLLQTECFFDELSLFSLVNGQRADGGARAGIAASISDLASEEVRDSMRTPLIVDGRNFLDPEAVRAAGFEYEGIGRA